MTNIIHKSLLLPTTIIAILLCLQQKLATESPLPKIIISKQQSTINLNDDLIDIFSLGNKRLLSSLIWIETLLESDLEHYQSQDLGSWMFLRFNTLSKIDPNFYQIYRFGGQYLSIVKDDETGAAKIYEKGLKLFPNDFWLNFHAAFHYYFEMGNSKRAQELYETIAYTPKAEKHAPYLPSILARLIAEEKGINENTFELINTSYKQFRKNSNIKQRLQVALYAIRAEIDLNCLNRGKKNCHLNDFAGVPYKRHPIKNIFYAAKQWKKFRVHKKRPTQQSRPLTI